MPEPSSPRPAFRREILAELARHGLAPKADTPPAFLREFLNELYRYELRQLRDRLLKKEFTHRDLAPRVIELRKRYPLLSIPVERWTV